MPLLPVATILKFRTVTLLAEIVSVPFIEKFSRTVPLLLMVVADMGVSADSATVNPVFEGPGCAESAGTLAKIDATPKKQRCDRCSLLIYVMISIHELLRR